MKNILSFSMIAVLVISTMAQASETPQPTNHVTAIQVSVYDRMQLFSEEYSVWGLRLDLPYGNNFNVYGLDIGIINSVAGDLMGIEVGIANSIVYTRFPMASQGGVTGLQIGGANFCWNEVHGIQVGLKNDCNILSGGQLLGVYNEAARGFRDIGIQAGIYNAAGGDMQKNPSNGGQLGLLNMAHNLRGAEVGAVNIAFSVRGLQVGLFNSTEAMYGIQIGLVNRIGDNYFRFLPVVNARF